MILFVLKHFIFLYISIFSISIFFINKLYIYVKNYLDLKIINIKKKKKFYKKKKKKKKKVLLHINKT